MRPCRIPKQEGEDCWFSNASQVEEKRRTDLVSSAGRAFPEGEEDEPKDWDYRNCIVCTDLRARLSANMNLFEYSSLRIQTEFSNTGLFEGDSLDGDHAVGVMQPQTKGAISLDRQG